MGFLLMYDPFAVVERKVSLKLLLMSISFQDHMMRNQLKKINLISYTFF